MTEKKSTKNLNFNFLLVFHQVVRFFAEQIKSVDDVIDTMFMLIPFNSEQEQQQIRSLIPDIKQFLCMDPNEVTP